MPTANDLVADKLKDLCQRMVTLEKRKGWAQAWDLALKVMMPISLLTMGWVIGMEVRVSTIESNRFTARDATAMRDQIMTSLPPLWLREDVKEIKADLKANGERLRAIEINQGKK